MYSQYVAEKIETTDELIAESVAKAKESGYVKRGDLVVIAAGIPVQFSGTTNMLKVHIVGEVLVQGKGAGTAPGFGNAKIVSSPTEAQTAVKKDDVLVVKNLDKDYITVLDKVAGIIAEEGGLTSHLAIEALSRGIPLIVNAGGATSAIKTGTFITLDVLRGTVYSGKANII